MWVMASFSGASPEFSGKNASEVSTILYNRIIPWSNIQSAGVFLSQANEALIEKAQSHLESFLVSSEEAAGEKVKHMAACMPTARTLAHRIGRMGTRVDSSVTFMILCINATACTAFANVI